MSGKSYRRKYYDVFSKIYDRFVALHSKDTQSNIREFLANITPISRGDRVLDICTGTGTLLLYLSRKVSDRGLVIGADFSRGMLEVAKQKVQFSDNAFLVESDVAFLPFKSASFDAVTCSHAFYELKGDVQDQVLKDIVRILKPGKPFLMMEHDLPENKFVRFLLYIRFFSMGAKKAIEILKHEKEMLEKYFHSVKKVETPTGRSKVWICYKGG
ncbi:MAG TPA: methyltransferase domain-containing protein [Deltaproteobacteria bacterium]|nr:methyltransferase domain-containing protein [Deltaproteobacteria bacterium]